MLDRSCCGMRRLSARPKVITNADLEPDRRYHRRVDHAAHRHPPAPHRRRRRAHLRPRRRARRGAALADAGADGRPTSTSSSWRPRRPTTPSRPPRSRVQQKLGMHHGAAFDIQAVCSGFVFALTTADAHDQGRPGQAGAGDRRRNLLAHPRLDRPRDLRAVRRRRRRRGARGRAQPASDRPRHPRRQPPLRRPLQGQALCRRRPVDDRHRRASAHGRARGLQPRRRHDHRRHRGNLRRDRLSPPTTSTGSCRIRPTCASSTRRAKKLGIAEREGDPHRRPPRQHLGRLDPAGALRRRRATAASSAATLSCSRRWAAASPGARCSCAGRQSRGAPAARPGSGKKEPRSGRRRGGNQAKAPRSAGGAAGPSRSRGSVSSGLAEARLRRDRDRAKPAGRRQPGSGRRQTLPEHGGPRRG